MFSFKKARNPRLLGISEHLSSNALRNSTTVHKFTKSVRLIDYTYKGCTSTYLPQTSSTRIGFGFGYGSRTNFATGKNRSPGPCHYNLDSLFETNMKKKKGTSVYGKPKEIVGS